jgi:hypothetical protein
MSKAAGFTIALTLASLFFFACHTTPAELANPSENTAYSLSIIDSLQIPLLPSGTFIQDIHPESGNILLMQDKGRQRILYEVSPKGVVLQEFEHPTDGPQNAGRSLLNACYFEDDFALLGSFGAILFTDNRFSPKHRVRIPVNFALTAYPGYRYLQKVLWKGRPHLVMYYGPHTEKDLTTAEYYADYNLLTLFDPESETFAPIGSIPQQSIFRNGKAHYFLDTRFQALDGELAAVIINENLLYKVDLNSGETSFQELPVDEFVLHTGYSLGPQGLNEQGDFREVNGLIRSYVQADGLDILVYTSGLTQEKRESLAGRGDDSEAWEILREAMPYKYRVSKDGLPLSEVLPFPTKLRNIALVDRKGFLWATQNIEALAEEPELITLNKLRINRPEL